MKRLLPRRSFPLCAALLLGCVCTTTSAFALDLLPSFFEKPKVTAKIWEVNEQYVNLVEIESKAPLNDHPVTLDQTEVAQALNSLQLWTKGGVFRDEESSAVYTKSEVSTIAAHIVEALAKASPNEDVTFNVRSYADALMSIAKERQWTTGRVFYKDGKLNLIVGEYQKRLDKGKKAVEGSFGVSDDFRDVNFDLAGRSHKGKMPGRIVTGTGVEPGKDGRPDWVAIDVKKAAAAWREAQVPATQRKANEDARAEAAKLTLERRSMREEMARMRKELKDLQDGNKADVKGKGQSVEERLSKLQQLLDKGLISADDYKKRKQAILEEI